MKSVRTLALLSLLITPHAWAWPVDGAWDGQGRFADSTNDQKGCEEIGLMLKAAGRNVEIYTQGRCDMHVWKDLMKLQVGPGGELIEDGKRIGRITVQTLELVIRGPRAEREYRLSLRLLANGNVQYADQLKENRYTSQIQGALSPLR